MKTEFFGTTYMYPTPDGEREVGVIHMNKTSRTFTVGYFGINGLVERVESAAIPAMQEPDKLQQRLDKRAIKLGLKEAHALLVRECVSADAVLPPEKSNKAAVTIACQSARVTLDKNADPVGVARVVSERWDRAQAGLADILYFGATLLEVQAWVEATGDGVRRGDAGKIEGRDPGLKGWIAEHCPTINYKTAYGYMCAASGLRREAKLADDVPLLAMMGMDAIPEARAEKLRKRVQRIISDSTLRLLREAAMCAEVRGIVDAEKGGAREGAGRPTAQHEDGETAAGAAWAVIGRATDRATAWHFERFLPEAIVREAISTVGMLKEALEARLQEIGKGSANVD